MDSNCWYVGGERFWKLYCMVIYLFISMDGEKKRKGRAGGVRKRREKQTAGGESESGEEGPKNKRGRRMRKVKTSHESAW